VKDEKRAADDAERERFDAWFQRRYSCSNFNSSWEATVAMGHAWNAWQAALSARADGGKDSSDARDAERYRWLSRKVSAHGVIDGWAFGFPSHLTLPAPPLAMREPAAALGQAIDAAIAGEKK
jgi:hypothetical protein